MKTATVRELRNNFATISKHLEWGEEITITRNGTPVAKLCPPATKKPTKAAWRRFLTRKPLGKKLSLKETEEFWSRLRD